MADILKTRSSPSGNHVITRVLETTIYIYYDIFFSPVYTKFFPGQLLKAFYANISNICTKKNVENRKRTRPARTFCVRVAISMISKNAKKSGWLEFHVFSNVISFLLSLFLFLFLYFLFLFFLLLRR